jgi:cell division protein FtsA
MGELVVGLDIGTSKVCTVVGEVREDDIFIVGVGIEPARGMKKGIVSDIEALAAAISESVNKAERSSGYVIDRAFVSVAGDHIASSSNRGMIGITGQRAVNREDMSRVLEAARAIAIPHNREVLHVVPRKYSLDGQERVRSPVGMHGFRLELEAHIITALSSCIANLEDAVARAGLKVDRFVLNALASGHAVLTPEEREMGVVVIDIGGGTTDLVVFHDGLPHYTSAIAVGGFQFTNDIALIYDTAYSTAESVKLNYAHTDPGGTSAHEEITLQVLGPARERKVHLHDICQLTRERAMELADVIKMKLKDAGVRNTFDSRIVLTGGASVMPGLLDLMHRMVSPNIRIGTPNGNVVMPDGLRAPSFSTSAGILLWAADQAKSGPVNAAHSNAAHSNGARSNGARSNGAHSNDATHTNHNGKANGTSGKSGAGSIFARPFRALRN